MNNALGGFAAAMTGSKGFDPEVIDAAIENPGDNTQLEFNDDELVDLSILNPPIEDEDPEDNNPDEKNKKSSKGSKSRKKDEFEAQFEDDDEEEELDNEDNNEDDNDDFLENESVFASGIYSSLADKLGIDVGEDSPETFDDVVEHMINIIQENSTPVYASEDVAALDNFVKNGGDIRAFFKEDRTIGISDKDLKSESGQRRILETLLKEQGNTAEQISAKIDRYEMSGILEDEATDALDELNKITNKKQQSLLVAQEKERVEMERRQQEQYEGVISAIKDLRDLNGIAVSKQEKAELARYMFQPTASGRTQMEIDNSDVKNIVAVAHILKNKDTIINNAKHKGQSEAMKAMRENLRNQSRKSSGKNRSERFPTGNPEDTLSSVAANVTSIFGLGSFK